MTASACTSRRRSPAAASWRTSPATCSRPGTSSPRSRQQQPLLGEDPDFTDLVPERRDRRRLHHLDQRPRGAEERHQGRLGGARGGRQDGHRLPVDPEGAAGERTLLGQAVHQSRVDQGGAAGLAHGLGLPGVVPGLKPPADLVDDPSYPTKEEQFKQLIRSVEGAGRERERVVRQVQGDHAGLNAFFARVVAHRSRRLRARRSARDCERCVTALARLSPHLAHHRCARARRVRLLAERARKALPYLMLLPAILLVGLLVLGLVQIADTSLRRSTPARSGSPRTIRSPTTNALSETFFAWSRAGACSAR